MGHFQTIRIESVDELRRAASDWDDLWWRSASASPLHRAETLALWLEHFAVGRQFAALAVVEDDCWTAALPLVSQRLGRLFTCGAMPGNPWASCGDLLLDATADQSAALEQLFAAAKQMNWPLWWLDEAVAETPQWKSLMEACNRTGIAAVYHQRYRVGRLNISADWNGYLKRLPKNHRQAMARAERRLAAAGSVRFKFNEHVEPAEVETILQEAFELEALGWKGRQGSSVLGTPGMFEFYLGQSRQLARWGQLAHAELRLDGRLLAFVHGFQAKGVLFANKIGYHPDFSAFSPGQLLFYLLIERLHQRRQFNALDFMGPMNQSLGRWRPETYGVGRLVAATGGWQGHLLLGGYKLWRRLRRGAAPEAFDSTLPPPPPTVETEKTPSSHPAAVPVADDCIWSVP